MLASLTVYSALKAFHVLAAVVWVGGGAGLTILALRAERSKDSQRIAAIAKDAEWLGMRVFLPTSLVLFVLGAAMLMTHTGTELWSWSQAWVIVGLVGFALSTVVGAGYLGPTSGRYRKLLAERGVDDPEVRSLLARILLVARIDVMVLLVVAADMVVKPGAGTL